MKTKKLYKSYFSNIQYFFFAFFIFSCYIQFPFPQFARFIIPSFFCFLLFNVNEILRSLNKQAFCFFALFGIHLGICLLKSAFTGADLSSIIRFTLILIMLPLCFSYSCDEDKIKQLYKIFMFITYLKVLSLILIYLSYLTVLDYGPFRYYANLHGGDIYILGLKYFLKIQVRGNALVLDAFLLNLLNYKKIKKSTIFLGIGVLLCGNFAFIGGAILMVLYVLIRKILGNKKNMQFMPLYFLIVLIFLLGATFYFTYKMTEKKDYSNAIRNEQIYFLLRDDFYFGNGLGHRITGVGKYRDYSYMKNYFEYQSLYIVNQIGFIGYFMFIFYSVYMVYYRRRDIDYIVCYFVYLIYSFFNPYCFDTSHMLFAILLTIPNTPISLKKCISF